MKLLRYGPKGMEKPGLIDSESRIRDLSPLLADITTSHLSPDGISALKALDISKLPVVNEVARLGVPYHRPGKVICVGLNYSDHAAETGQAAPDQPVLFLKATSSLRGPNDPVVLPQNSTRSDWEVELGVVIGSTARYVTRAEAMEYVAGYCVVNDLSERHFQLECGGQWDKGKGCDTFGPVGPWLVTRDEISDPQALDLWLEVNGRTFQSGSTRNMLFDIATLVSYISQFMTLDPGDLISTGTPAGVGHGQKPTIYLRAGDTIRLGISGLGEQTQRVFAWDRALLD